MIGELIYEAYEIQRKHILLMKIVDHVKAMKIDFQSKDSPGFIPGEPMRYGQTTVKTLDYNILLKLVNEVNNAKNV